MAASNLFSGRSVLWLSAGGLAVWLVGCGSDAPAAYPGASSGASGAAATAGDSNPSGGASGGSSGGSITPAAGAGGADVAPPKVVGKCDKLGAVDAFEDITPPGTNLSPSTDAAHGNGVVNVVADPVHPGTIYAGTDQSGLQKSTDCGSTWTHIDTGHYAGNLDKGILWSMALDPVDPTILYLGALYADDSSLLKSSNGGVDFDTLFPKGSEVEMTVQFNFFQDLSIDPTNHKHIVVTFHGNCTGPSGPNCMGESKDSGATWRLLKGPLMSWGEGAAPLVINDTTFIMGTTQNGIYYTADSGANWEKVAPGSNRNMYKAVTGSYYLSSGYGVQRSVDGGHTWMQVPGAPNSDGLKGDGKRIFTAERDAKDGVQPYFVSDEKDGTTWKRMKSPNMKHGAVTFAYDEDHHVMYSANISSGLFRFVTQ